MLVSKTCLPQVGSQARGRVKGRLGLLLFLGGTTPIVRPLADGTSSNDGNPNIALQNGDNRDCEYFGWSSWSSCIGAEAYGVPTGVHTRKRSVKSPERGSQGKTCSSPMLDAALCLTKDGTVKGDAGVAANNDLLTGAVGAGAENVDASSLPPCTLADWGMWSGCSSQADSKSAGSFSCGYASESRSRSPSNSPCILGPEVREAFMECELEDDGTPRGCRKASGDLGSLLESRLCPVGVCNVDCVVGTWGGFGKCSKTCGTGTVRRQRTVAVSAGGDGLPCPHLVESKNCHDRDCDVDCQVGDFSDWGKCWPIDSNNGNANCARNRSRPVLVKRIGSGKACPSLQDFKNCGCPSGLKISARGGGFWGKLTNSTSPMVAWIGPTAAIVMSRLQGLQAFAKSAKDPPWGTSWWQRLLWYLLLGFLALLALGSCCLCCRCCCRSCCSKRARARKVADPGFGSDSDMDYRNDRRAGSNRPTCCERCYGAVCCCCPRRNKQTRAVAYADADDASDIDTYAGSRYSNGSAVHTSASDWQTRDANLEGWREGTPLLSERPVPRGLQPQLTPEAWQNTWQDPALMATTASLPAAGYAYGQGGQFGSTEGNGYSYGSAGASTSLGGSYPRDYRQLGGPRSVQMNGGMPSYDTMAGYSGAPSPYGAAAAAYAAGANGYGGRSVYGDGPSSYGTGAAFGPVVGRFVERAPYNIIDTSSGSFIEPVGPKPGYGEFSPQPTPSHFHQAGGSAGMRPY